MSHDDRIVRAWFRPGGKRNARAAARGLGVLASLTAASVAYVCVERPAETAAPVPVTSAMRAVHRAEFGTTRASQEVRRVADWAVDSGDHGNAPFVIVDKVDAKVYAFDGAGKLLGSAPALLGITRGDDTAAGVGDKPLSQITLAERTTGAGRYIAELGFNLRGEDVLWVDYAAGLSLHRVLRTNPAERRVERLATPTPLDNRVSYGCINVPVRFFEDVIRPAYRGTRGVVYVLPETRPATTVFTMYDVDQRARSIAVAAAPSVGPH